MALNVNETMFKGDKGSNNEFDGLEQFEIDGYATGIETDTNGGPLSLGILDEAISEAKDAPASAEPKQVASEVIVAV